MTFAYKLKKELCGIKNAPCCELAQFYGLLMFANTFSPSEIKIVSENDVVAEYALNAFHSVACVLPELQKKIHRNGSVYIISVTEQKDISRVMLKTSVNFSGLNLSINHSLLDRDCCRNAFLRGAFLSGGTVSDPTRSYHFELSTPRRRLCDEISTMLMEYDIGTPKYVERKSNHVVYFKDSTAIEDMLNILGAKISEFEFINMKIEKQIRNEANRIANCETANISKTVNAAQTIIRNIEKIKKSGRFEFLDADVKRVAEVRLENPEVSLSELGEMLNPPLSKTAVYNKLKKIEKMK